MVFLLVPLLVPAQQPGSGASAGTGEAGSSQQLSLLLQKPLDVFDWSHSFGVGAGYTHSPGRFGMEATPAHAVGWIAQGNIEFFAGRSHPAEGYAFRYSSYFYAQLMGGLIWNPLSYAHISLTAGPGLGLYGGGTSAGFNGMLQGNVFVDERISVGPMAGFRKHREAAGLFSAGIRVGWTL